MSQFSSPDFFQNPMSRTRLWWKCSYFFSNFRLVRTATVFRVASKSVTVAHSNLARSQSTLALPFHASALLASLFCARGQPQSGPGGGTRSLTHSNTTRQQCARAKYQIRRRHASHPPTHPQSQWYVREAPRAFVSQRKKGSDERERGWPSWAASCCPWAHLFHLTPCTSPAQISLLTHIARFLVHQSTCPIEWRKCVGNEQIRVPFSLLHIKADTFFVWQELEETRACQKASEYQAKGLFFCKNFIRCQVIKLKKSEKITLDLFYIILNLIVFWLLI